ncbi:uncharacterized protein LOC116342783 [Contarinia nasturtii]|uniref:uncharacterized protein LOC116342783 n=1 Tax=Contarinia nasturtii TaxID=265458 RepID=UPI0012D47400|nr:uncharacterized protein LOC116342783 [Contarinia nasturtii]
MSAAKKNWTFDEVQALIHAVRKNPSLYDRRDPDYNQTRTKEDIWKTISTNAAIVEKNAEECKKKWKTLRIQQRRIIIKKIKKNEKRSAIQWNCYEALKFLIPHMDWTATDEIKKDPELDLSILSDMCDDEEPEECDETYENEENCESQSESSYGSSQMYHDASVTETAAQAADSTNISRTDALCTLTTTPMFTATGTPVTTDNKMNQYLVAYLPTAAQANPIQIRNDMMDAQANCVSINNGTANAPHTMYATSAAAAAEPAQSTTTSPLDTKYSMNNQQRIITVPVSTGPIVNYFLMDLAVQMERLNDIAQMELKIEIHRLLLEKLKNVNNLRQTQTSICFTTPQNPN